MCNTTNDSAEEEKLGDQKDINKRIEEETGTVVQIGPGERYKALVTLNIGDRDEPNSA